MQAELDHVIILGVNETGHEEGNEGVTEGRDLPWLQDVEDTDVWATWGVDYRDVIVLDHEGVPLFRYNLTEHDLGTDYDQLKQLLDDAG